MLSEQVTILACEAGTLTLQSQRKTTCQGCNLRKGCGQYLLMNEEEGTFTLAPETWNAKAEFNEASLKIGSQVELQAGAGTLVIVTMLFYMMPLGFLLIGLLTGLAFSLTEPMLVVSSFSGLGVGILLARKWLAQYEQKRLVEINISSQAIKA